MELFLGDSNQTFLLELLVAYLHLETQGKVKVIHLSKGALKAIAQGSLGIKTPTLVFSTGEVKTSVAAILRQLIQLTVWEDVLLGKSQTQKKEIDEIVSRYPTVEADTVQNLHKFLEPRTFAVSNHITIADLHLFALLHSRVTQFSDNDRNHFNNVYRWFKHIQNLNGVHEFLVRAGRTLLTESHLNVPFSAGSQKKKK